MLKLYKNHQIRAIESYVTEKKLDSEYGLMKKAGAAAFLALQEKWPDAKQIVVCCGKGNNAGDGFVLAKLAYEAEFEITLITVCDPKELGGVALQAATDCLQAGVRYQLYQPGLALAGDVVVDALLGSGLKGELREPYSQFIQTINESAIPVLSIDVPSGIDVDTGSVQGIAIQANLTITFIANKPGLLTNKAPAYCGELITDNLQISSDVFAQFSPSGELLQWVDTKPLLPHRRKDTHKGDYGHVLVIGGDYGMGGAVRMAAEAAMRVGAGLVTVATRPEHVSVVSGSRPEIMCHEVSNCQALQPMLKRATVVVIGPGLGKSDWAKELLHCVISLDKPKVFDADSLNLLSEEPSFRNDWVLTPHSGEASRLLGRTNQDIQDDRFTAIEELYQKYGGVIVLKGAGTLVKGNNLVKVCPAGNPGMASGGMGDILSGVIGGLIAQKLSLQTATEVGVLVHSLAADYAAKEGGERGLLATDLLSHLRRLVNP